MKRVLAFAGVPLFGILALAVLLGAAVSGGCTPGSEAASDTAQSDIPGDLLAVYQAAAQTCTGLPWSVLAAVGATESHHAQGRADPATGDVRPPIVGPALDGANGYARILDPTMPDGWAHALGPMQFLSTTWAEWGRVAPHRPAGAQPDVHNAWDAIYSAAAYLCGGEAEITDVKAALFRYNRSHRYVDQVLAKANEYTATGADSGPGQQCATAAVALPPPGQLAWPVDGPVTSGFGYRVHPIYGDWRFHAGIDISATMSTPVRAPAAGTVEAAGSEGGCGNSVTIDHGGELSTRYCHLSAITTHTNQPLATGDVFALVGSTGTSTGPHLHFEVYDHDQLRDPLAYLTPR